jgi:hypothetical protein
MEENKKKSRISAFLGFTIVRYFKKLENTQFRKIDLIPSSGEMRRHTLLRQLTTITGREYERRFEHGVHPSRDCNIVSPKYKSTALPLDHTPLIA